MLIRGMQLFGVSSLPLRVVSMRAELSGIAFDHTTHRG
jgi:hypothetical protein